MSLHVHERIDPRTILEAVRRKETGPIQASLFDQPSENPPLYEALDFYKHPHGWSNRLIAGDSLLGQPDVQLQKNADGKFKVEVAGFDYYDPRSGAIESGDTSKIAMWLLDTDYDGRSLLPRQVFFPRMPISLEALGPR